MPKELADVTLNGSAGGVSGRTQFTSTSTRAAWVGITAPATNGGAIRVGGASVGAAQGISIAQGGGFFFAPMGNAFPYDLMDFYGYSATPTDKITVIYGP